MSNNIDLKQGLNIPISGAAVQKTRKTVSPDVIAVKPTDFKGLTPRLLVKEGDRVLAGSPVLADKKNPDILVTSPVSGTVSEVVRGEKRKLLEVKIKADGQQEYVDFGSHKVSEMTADDVKELLLKSGLWAGLVQRPYGIVADPSAEPKAIFVSAFSTAPLITLLGVSIRSFASLRPKPAMARVALSISIFLGPHSTKIRVDHFTDIFGFAYIFYIGSKVQITSVLFKGFLDYVMFRFVSVEYCF